MSGKYNTLYCHLYLRMLVMMFLSTTAMADDNQTLDDHVLIDRWETPQQQRDKKHDIDSKNMTQQDNLPKELSAFVSQDLIKNLQQQFMYHLKHFLNESRYTAFLLILMLSTANLAWLLRFEWESSVKWINRIVMFGLLIVFYNRKYFNQSWQDFINHSLLAVILVVCVLEVYFAFSDNKPLKGLVSAIIGMVMMIGVFDMFHLSLWF